jgi:hypothetical protein
MKVERISPQILLASSLITLLILSSIYLRNGDINFFEQHDFELSGLNEPSPIPEIQVSHNLMEASDNHLVNYTELSPLNSGGRTTCMVIDLNDSDHLIVGTATGGLWSSINRGETWTQVDDFAPSLRINSLVQDKGMSNVYYYCSVDLFEGVQNARRPGIFKSTDTGKTFQIIGESSSTEWSEVQKIADSDHHENDLYALGKTLGFGQQKKLYRSEDGGASFEVVYVPSSNYFHEFHVLSDGAVLVVDGSDIYRSNSGDSSTYVLANGGLSSNGTYSSLTLASCASDPDYVYALAVGGTIRVGVFKSVNGGSNWTYTGVLNSGVHTRAIGVKPDDPNFVFAGSVGLNVTLDGGETWSGYQAAGVDYWSVNYDPNNPDVAFVTYYGGVARFDLDPFMPNPWDAVTRMDSLLRNTQIHAGDFFPSSNSVIVGMQDIGTRVRMADGSSLQAGSNDGSYCYIHKQDSNTAYVSWQNGRIMKKENVHIPFRQVGYKNPEYILGQMDTNNDNKIDEGALFIHPFWVNYTDGDQLYCPTKKRLWRSLDGGDNWEPISNNFLGVNYAMTITGSYSNNPNLYWSVNDTLYIMPKAKTSEKGDEFKVKAPFWIRFIRIAPDNDSMVYVVVNISGKENIYRSSNLFEGDVTWTPIPRGNLNSSNYINCLEVNPDNIQEMVIGTTKGLYVTVDGGENWTKELCFPNVQVRSSKIRRSDSKLFFYTYGRGAWSANFPEQVPVGVHQAVKTEFEVYVWPNPAVDQIHVGLQYLMPDLSLEIYDLKGVKWKEIHGVQQNPFSLSTKELPAGTYVLHLLDHSEVKGRQKFIKR